MRKKTPAPGEITLLLRKLNKKTDPETTDQLASLVYADLRLRAQALFRMERPGHILQPTAIVNETFIRLMGGRRPTWKTRGHFFGVAVRLMRQILVDHARQTKAKKRGAGAAHEPIEEAMVYSTERPDLTIQLDDALTKLDAIHPRPSKVFHFRYFAGLQIDEVAKALGVGRTTVISDWDLAKAWLKRELSE